MVILAIFLGLAYTSPMDVNEDDDQNFEQGMNPIEYKEELSSLLSIFVSKYAMFPILVVEVAIYVYLNVRLIWIWYSTGEWDTIANKFTFLQRIWGILYMVGSPIDFWIRLYGHTTFTHIVWKMEMENYCLCWMIIYKSMFYASMTYQMTVAVIRYTCVVYPIEYHSRSAENVFLLCSESFLAGTQMRRQEQVSFISFVCWLLFLRSLSLGLIRPVILHIIQKVKGNLQ